MKGLYFIGLSGVNSLLVDENMYYHTYKLETGDFRIATCNIEEKWMKINEMKIDKEDIEEVDLVSLKKGVVIDLNENGVRWEGDLVNGLPFGYGCVYNENNELVYVGFMCDGKKVCFGKEFYGDLGIVEYVGGFYNNMRLGYGKLYNKKNELVYEGDFPVETHVIIESVLNENEIHNHLEELKIKDNIKTDIKYFQLVSYYHLHNLEIGSNCFENVEDFRIDACIELISITIGNNSFSKQVRKSIDNNNPLLNNIGIVDDDNQLTLVSDDDFFSCYIVNCPKLESLTIGVKSFQYYSLFTIESIFISYESNK